MLIYKAENTENGKVYIGKTTESLRRRKYNHKSASKNKQRYKSMFYNAIRKYGFDKFKFTKIDAADSKKELNKKEIFYIKEYDSLETGYNMTSGGDGFVKEEHPMYGKKRPKISKMFSGEGHPMYGRKHTREACKLMSRKRSGEKNPMYGKKHSKETKEKMRIAAKKRVGKKGPSYDDTIYTFVHKDYGILECTQFELKKNFGVGSNISDVINGKRYSAKGWSIKGTAKPKPMSGTQISSSKMNMTNVIEIRCAYNIGCFTYKEIAKAYNISVPQVGRIIRRENWKHV